MTFNEPNKSFQEGSGQKLSEEERVLYTRMLRIFGGPTRNIDNLGDYREEVMTLDKVKERIEALELLEVIEKFKAKIFGFLPKHKDEKEKNNKEQDEAFERLERAVLKAHEELKLEK